MLLELPDDLFALRVCHLALQHFEGEVDNVMMMDFAGSDFITQLEPHAVQKIDLFRREMRSMRTKVEDLILSARKIELKSQLRFWIGQPFPCEARQTRVFDHGCFVG